MDIFEITLSSKAISQLKKLPAAIQFKLQMWIESVKMDGLREVRKIPGFHDEPLQGKRKGQRSIRLSRAYRAMYIIHDSGEIEFVEVLEVNKHEY